MRLIADISLIVVAFVALLICMWPVEPRRNPTKEEPERDTYHLYFYRQAMLELDELDGTAAPRKPRAVDTSAVDE